jgi:hypothetical protein
LFTIFNWLKRLKPLAYRFPTCGSPKKDDGYPFRSCSDALNWWNLCHSFKCTIYGTLQFKISCAQARSLALLEMPIRFFRGVRAAVP